MTAGASADSTVVKPGRILADSMPGSGAEMWLYF